MYYTGGIYMKLGIHIVSYPVGNDKYVAFDPLSKAIIILNKNEKEILEKFQNNEKCLLSEYEKQVIKDIEEVVRKKREETTKALSFEPPNPIMMVLMVSQTCNLACKYCYAHSGTYNTPGLMKFEIGKMALDVADELGITNIQFYGGEPLMNFRLIEKLIEYADNAGYTFKYGIITNGTLITEEIAEFFKQHEFDVTISIDGPKEINDINRVYPDDTGTHDDIIRAIDLLNEREVPLALEITYARNYVKIHSISEILDYLSRFSKTFIVGYVFPTVDGKKQEYEPTEQEVADMMVELVDYLFSKWEQGIPIKEMGTCMILRELLSPTYYIKKCICPELPARLTVFYDGKVYPCHQVYLDHRFYLGEIVDKDFSKMLEDRFERVIGNFSISKLSLNPGDKWMASVCSFCKAHLDEIGGKYYLRYAKAYQKSLDRIIYNIATRDMNTVIKTLGGMII